MAKLAYNNAENASIGYTLFKLNCSFYFRAFYKEDVNLQSKSKTANKLDAK